MSEGQEMAAEIQGQEDGAQGQLNWDNFWIAMSSVPDSWVIPSWTENIVSQVSICMFY